MNDMWFCLILVFKKIVSTLLKTLEAGRNRINFKNCVKKKKLIQTLKERNSSLIVILQQMINLLFRMLNSKSLSKKLNLN